MPRFFRKQITTSALTFLLAIFTVQAQTLSGYTGSTSATDGYKGDIRKVIVTKKQYDPRGMIPVTETWTEYLYNSKGQRIETNTPEHNIKYTYGNGFFIITAENRLSAKAIFNSDGTLKSYETYNNLGKLLRRDEYIYKNGKIAEMERIGNQDELLSKWTYTTDSDGNTFITDDKGTSSYTFNPEGVLVREYTIKDENNSSEKTYDENGFEKSLKLFSFPASGTTLSRNIPTTDISYSMNCITDQEGRISEIKSDSLIKLNDKWYNADGNYVSSEERRNGRICLTWVSYRYDGLLAEVQTEYWTNSTEENTTGYTSRAEEYFYNNDDLLTQIITYDETGSETDRVVYRYDENGQLMSTESDVEPKTQVSYTWNEDGTISSKLTQNIQNDKFIANIEEYLYDENGDVMGEFITSIQKNSSAEESGKIVQFATRTESRFFYDPNKILRKKETFSREKTETEFYDYDENGRIILTALYTERQDGTITYSEKAFKYEEDEDFTKVTEYDSLRTKKEYSYDKAGNISCIKEYETRYKDGFYRDIITSTTEYTYN